MALALFDRVQETTTTTGTGSITLGGAVPGFQSFAVVGNGNTCYYTIVDVSAWEVGVGTYSTSGPTLARTTILSNSNGNTSAITLAAGTKSVFLTYPASKSVNLNESGNVSPLGTVSSGVWQGTTVGVAYGGTGVTASSGANSVVLRDASQNITVNRINQGLLTTTASGGTTTLTAASAFNQALVGTGGHTYRLPDATTLSDTTTFQFNNNATGTLTIENNAGTAVGTIASGGAAGIALLSNATVGGTWDVHAYIPENVTWGTNSLALGSTVISGGTWQGGTIQPAYGGTGLTSYTSGGAVYANSSTTLTSGTLPLTAGGTGATTASGARTNLDVPSTSGSGASGTWGINISGNAATSTTTAQTNFSNLTIGGSQVLYAGNYNSYAPTLTGTGASGTWGINITGSAASATTAGKTSATTVPASTAFSKWLFATNSTSGTLDWNDPSNTIPGVGTTLLLGNATNGPGGGNYYHPFNVEYSGISGTGNVTQMAIAYGSPANELYMRGSYSGSWSSWVRFLNTYNYNLYAPSLTGSGASGTWNISITGSAGTAGSVDYNALTNKGGGTGSYITSGDYRAPIFYDSNDTSFAIDPNATSAIRSMTVGYNGSSYAYDTAASGKLYFGSSSTDASTYYYISTNMENYNGNYTKLDVRWYTGQRFYAHSTYGGFRFYEITNNLQIFSINEGGNFALANQSMRAPIFYDSDNTGYYVDPNATSNLVSLTVANTISGSISSVNASTATGIQTSYSATINTTTPGLANYGFAFSGVAGSDYAQGITWGWNSTNAQAGIYVQSSGAYGTKMYFGTTDSFAVGSKTSMSIDHNGTIQVPRGYLQSDYSLRAPIFYDSNNTGYYVDPASTSNLNAVNFNGVLAWADGTYALGSPSYGFRFNDTASTINAFVISNAGNTTSYASSRAPIFYDSNNTGYYVDPASVSLLNNLLVQPAAISNNINGLRNVMPGGGSYVTSSSVVSGAIVITLPVTVYPMLRFRVTVYTYDGLSFDIYCGGHTSGGTWYNTFAYMTTQSRSAMTVRFTYGGGSMYVYIGDLGSSWSYPQVFITDVQVGYTNYEYDKWDDGWSIGFNTSSYNNVSSSHTVFPPPSSGNNTNPVYANIYYDADNTGTYINPNGSSIISSGGSYPMEFRSSQRYITRFWNQGASSYGWWLANDANSIVFHADSLGDKAYLDTSGNFTAIGSYRSPIFYDSDNTAYYIDGASTSVLNNINVAGTIQSTNGNGALRLYGNLHIDSYNSNDIYLNYYSGRRVYAFYGSQVQSFRADLDGIVYAFYQFRTPITYDYDNTGYYSDPASTSQFNYLYAAGNIRGSAWLTGGYASTSSGYGGFSGTPSNGYLITTNIDYSTFNMPMVIIEGFAYGNGVPINLQIVWYSYNNGFVSYSYTNLGAWDPGTVRIGTNGSGKICIHLSNNIYYGRMNVRAVYDQGASTLIDWSVQQDVSYSGLSRVTVVGTANIRAGISTADSCYMPIMYDVSNTAYYVDPAGGSRMNGINADSLYSYGNVTAYSDERLKTDWEVLPADYVEKLAKVKSGTYTRIDSGERQVGVGAQSLQVILKEAVSEDQEYLGVNYGNAALASAVELAKYVTALEQRISQLEARL